MWTLRTEAAFLILLFYDCTIQLTLDYSISQVGQRVFLRAFYTENLVELEEMPPMVLTTAAAFSSSELKSCPPVLWLWKDSYPLF